MPQSSQSRITYEESLKLVSKLIKDYCKNKKLLDLEQELLQKGIKVNLNTLSAIKNKRLPHTYPGTIEKLLKFFGVKVTKRYTQIYFMVDTHQLNDIQTSFNGTKTSKKSE